MGRSPRRRVVIRHDHAPDNAWTVPEAWLKRARQAFSLVAAIATVVCSAGQWPRDQGRPVAATRDARAR
jgi:hypothetical protein